MLVTMSKWKLMKAKLTLKNKQMAPDIIYWGADIDGEKNILQLFPLKLMRIHSVLFLMMLDPLKYFKQFWDDEITNMLVKQTNLYSIEKSRVNINTNKDEIENLLAVQMLMSNLKMPRCEMYWSEATRYELAGSTLTLKSTKKLRELLHIVDNAEKDKPENKEDKCFKVKPLLEAVRANYQKVEQKVNYSIDEQIIPAKMKKSGGV